MAAPYGVIVAMGKSLRIGRTSLRLQHTINTLFRPTTDDSKIDQTMYHGRLTRFTDRGCARSCRLPKHAADDRESGCDIGYAHKYVAADDDELAVFNPHLGAFVPKLTEIGSTQCGIEWVGKLLAPIHGKNVAGNVNRQVHDRIAGKWAEQRLDTDRSAGQSTPGKNT